MALVKDIVNEKGILTKYHRIKNIDYNAGKLVVTIFSYADNNYREREIRQIQAMKLMEKNPEELTDEEFAFVQQYSAYEDLHIAEFYEVIDLDENISFGEIYNSLKELPSFEGAQDI